MALDNSTLAMIVTAAVGGVSATITSILSYMREGRLHWWQLEQAEEDRRERIRVAAELKRDHEVQASRLAENTRRETQALTQKIEENTQFNKEALKAANNVNEKIVAIGEVRTRGSKEDRRSGE